MEDASIRAKFLSCKTRHDIACLLDIDDKSLRYFLFAVKPYSLYNTVDIIQKNGKIRTISIPIKPLKKIQKKLSLILETVYIPTKSAYGFIKGKDFVENSKQHVSKKMY